MKYQKELKRLLNNELHDIIVFGSTVKGGIANDFDLVLIIKSGNALDYKKKIRSIVKNADLEVFNYKVLYTPFILTLIKEGFSIRENKYLSDIYKIKPSVLFKFSLKKLTNVQKVQFDRGLKNVLSEGVVLTRSVILVPMKIKSEIMDFLKNWNIYYESQEYELLPLMRKEVFL